MLTKSPGRFCLSDERESKRTKRLLSCYFQEKEKDELKEVSQRFHSVNKEPVDGQFEDAPETAAVDNSKSSPTHQGEELEKSSRASNTGMLMDQPQSNRRSSAVEASVVASSAVIADSPVSNSLQLRSLSSTPLYPIPLTLLSYLQSAEAIDEDEENQDEVADKNDSVAAAASLNNHDMRTVEKDEHDSLNAHKISANHSTTTTYGASAVQQKRENFSIDALNKSKKKKESDELDINNISGRTSFNDQRLREEIHLSLANDGDTENLSEADSFIRSEMLELFVATDKQIRNSNDKHLKNTSKDIKVIGLRCKFCQEESHSYCFPKSIIHLCGSAWDLAKKHTLECKCMPASVSKKWYELQIKLFPPPYLSPQHIYWMNCARRNHLVSYRGICIQQYTIRSPQDLRIQNGDDFGLDIFPQPGGNMSIEDSNSFHQDNLCFFLVRQFIPCTVDNRDVFDGCINGYQGFACLHCNAREETFHNSRGRCFPKTFHEFIHKCFFSEFFEHLMECPNFHYFSKELLLHHKKKFLDGDDTSDLSSKINYRTTFFLRNLWEKMHRSNPNLHSFSTVVTPCPED